MRLLPAGEHGVLVEVGSVDEAAALAAECRRRASAGLLAVADIVAGARTVLLDGVDPADVADIETWDVPSLARGEGPVLEIPVEFDGPDLRSVADAWGVGVEEVPGIVCGATLAVAFGGFAPGFAYLSGLGRETPRLATPRPRVPAGAVAVAGEFAGVYPSASPGGWQIIGRTDVAVWDATRNPPALLASGARVRFTR